MNKLFIVLLAVCLVSTHAFVKRDAPSTSDAQSHIDTMTKKAGEIGDDIKDGAAKAIDTIKKSFDGFVESDSKMLSSFKPAAEGEATKAQ